MVSQQAGESIATSIEKWTGPREATVTPRRRSSSLLGSWTDGSGPVYRRLADGRSARRSSAETIPPDRGCRPSGVLAERLAVSRTTVVSAYEQLRERAVDREPAGQRHARRAAPRGPSALRLKEDPAGSFRRHPVYRSLVEGSRRHDRVSRRAPARARDASTARLSGIDQAALGGARARPGLSARWGCRRCGRRSPAHLTRSGLETTEDQVLVTHGAQQAIGLAGALFVERGDAVVVENPTYLGLDRHLHGLSARGSSACRSAEDAAWIARAQGDRGALRAAPDLPDADVPEPDGRGAARGRPPRARAALARAPDPDRRGQHARRPLARRRRRRRRSRPSSRQAPILTIGSLSKLFWGGLRIGWIRASEEILSRITRLKIMADLGGSLIGQLVAVRLLARGRARSRRCAAREMRERLDRLTKLLARHLPDWSWDAARGRAVALGAPAAGDANAFAQVALRHGVAVVPGQPRLARRRLRGAPAHAVRAGGRADARGRRAAGARVGGVRRHVARRRRHAGVLV